MNLKARITLHSQFQERNEQFSNLVASDNNAHYCTFKSTDIVKSTSLRANANSSKTGHEIHEGAVYCSQWLYHEQTSDLDFWTQCRSVGEPVRRIKPITLGSFPWSPVSLEPSFRAVVDEV